MNFFVLCTKIEQDFYGVMSIRSPTLHCKLSTSAHPKAEAAFLTIPTRCLLPPLPPRLKRMTVPALLV
jgi:hypothetical protein